MEHELQRAGAWQRIAAGFLDIILTVTLAVGLAALLSLVTGYDAESQKLEEAYAAYESAYGISFELTQEEYEALDPQDKANYDAAYEALIADEEVLEAYNKSINLSLLIVSFAILGAILILEFILPLLLKNGQTIGKKVFGLGLVRVDSVALTPLQLFLRTLLGKYTVETMIPVYILMMLFWGTAGIFGTVLLFALLLVQIILFCATRNHSQLHDLMAGTVVVDLKSQQVFRTTEDLIAYQKQVAADKASRSPY